MKGLAVLGVFVAIVVLVAWDPLRVLNPEETAENKASATTADSINISEWPTQRLAELYVQFDNELEHDRIGDGITRDTRKKCLEWLEGMIEEYEAVIGGYEGAGGVVWPIKVCAEAEKEFWSRITKLESFGVPMWGPEESLIRLYRRYGALVNQGHSAAYHILAGSE